MREGDLVLDPPDLDDDTLPEKIDEARWEGRHVWIALDKVPAELNTSDRLRTRICQGVFVTLTLHDVAMREAALDQVFPDCPKVIREMILQRIGSLRETFGAALTAKTSFAATGDVYQAMQSVTPILEDPILARTIKVDEVLEIVSRHFDMPIPHIIGRTRTKSIVLVRHVVWYIARQLMQETLTTIGRKTGGYDHSSVLHGITRIKNELDVLKNRQLARMIENIETECLLRSGNRKRGALYGTEGSVPQGEAQGKE